MNRFFAYIALICVPLSLTAACGRPSTPKPTYQKMTIQQALQKVHFRVLQPTWFPFTVTNTFAEIGSMETSAGTQTELILAYQNEQEQKTVVEMVTDQDVKVTSNGTEKNLKLSNGKDAVYQSFSQLEALYWWPDGESYSLQDKQGPLTSNDTKPFLSPEQLVQMANSVK